MLAIITHNPVKFFDLHLLHHVFHFQGPAGTRGPEGRQGEKGTKVSVQFFLTLFLDSSRLLIILILFLKKYGIVLFVVLSKLSCLLTGRI